MSSSDELRALARKYRMLLDLRRAHERTGAVEGREELRALATAFPGALRELDRLPVEEIEGRAIAIEKAAASGAPEPWMQWLVAYHGLLRAALFIKARLRSVEAPNADEQLAKDASVHARIEVDAAFVRGVTSPRGGRISHVVMIELASRFQTKRELIEAVVIGPRRPSPRVAPCR